MNLFQKKKSPLELLPKKTALVTGASSGIGRSLSLDLASRGYDVVLVSRDTQKLEQLSSEIENKYGKMGIVYTADLSQDTFPNQMKSFLHEQGIKINLLANNAGFGVHGAFSKTSLETEQKLLHVQLNSTIGLTKILLPDMIASGSGAILNVGSVYSFVPVPFQSVYGACKSFLHSFTVSLSHELKNTGVVVSILCPGTTNTCFRSASRHKINVFSNNEFLGKGMPPDEVARIGLDGMLRGQTVIVPGIANQLFVNYLCQLPKSFLAGTLSKINGLRGVNGKTGR